MNRTWVGLGSAVLVASALFVTSGSSTVSSQGVQSVPQLVPDPLWPELLPNKWTTGQVGGIAVDKRDHIWVFQRPGSIAESARAAAFDPPRAECCIPAPPVIEFDIDGKFHNAWGGPGQGYEWPTTEHGIFVDHNDNVWLSGSGRDDSHILKFTKAGKFLLQIGRKGQSKGSNDRENVNRAAGLFVHAATNELFVADGYGNRRVVVFDAATGAYKRHWGAYGKPPDDSLKPPSREELARGGPPPTTFSQPVHAVVVSRDGTVYVADRGNNRIQVFTIEGKFVREAFVRRETLQAEGTVHGLVLSSDRDQRFLYVADGSNKSLRILDRETLAILDSVGGRAGHGAREFFHIHGIATDSKGNIYLGEVNDGQRYLRYLFKGMGKTK